MWRTPVAQKSREKNIKIKGERTYIFLKKTLKRGFYGVKNVVQNRVNKF